MIGKRLLVSQAGEMPIEPIGVPTSVSYVGNHISPYQASVSSYYLYNVFFGYDGESLYYTSIGSGEATMIRQFKMSVPYDISTLSISSSNISTGWGTTTGSINKYFMNFSGTEALGVDYTFFRSGSTGTAWLPIAGGTYKGEAPFGGNYLNPNTVNEGQYIVMFGNSSSVNYLLKVNLATVDTFSTWGSSAQTSYNLSSYEPVGASSSLKFSGAVINEGLHLLQWDSLNSQIKIWQNTAAFDFSSPTLISTFSIPTSDTLIVGTEAEINISYQKGFLFAQRQGSNYVFQFEFTY
jgi:hypothetical protein